jgi:hypothetical protein
MLQPNSISTDPTGTGANSRDGTVSISPRFPRGSDGYAEQARKRERALGWVLWIGFAAVLLLGSL